MTAARVVLTEHAPTTAQLAVAAQLSVLTERAPTTALAKGAPLKMLTPRAPTTALNAHAVRDTVLTNRLPTTSLLAKADRLSVLAGVGLNPNTLGVHAPAFHPLTHNVIDQLLPRAASILLLEALGARALLLAVPARHLLLLQLNKNEKHTLEKDRIRVVLKRLAIVSREPWAGAF